VKYTRILITCMVMALFIITLNACKGKATQNQEDDTSMAPKDESGAYPTIAMENITLEPSSEELIDPGLEGEGMNGDNQGMETYPSISGVADSLYPGVSDEGLYPYPQENSDGGYPEPVTGDTGNSLPTSEQGQATATPTPTLAPLTTTEPSPTATLDEVAPLTPTQSPTPSPTVIPTATALPLVVDRSLQASDPKLVKLASGKVQLIEFFAFWDATSKALAPMMNQLKVDYGKNINFHFLDIDDPATKNIKTLLSYRLQPHLFLVDQKGKVLKDWTGFVDEVEIRDEIAKALLR
jgi:thiol-disulfide isomerase/thioredoxin